MTLKEAERALWTKEYYDTMPRVKYKEDIYETPQEKMDHLAARADDYYTKSQIDSIIQKILDEQDNLKEKQATRYIEDNVDILDYSIEDFLDRCPSEIVDVVVKILKNAEIITNEDVKKYLGRKASNQLFNLASKYSNSPLYYDSTALDPDWWENVKVTIGTCE